MSLYCRVSSGPRIFFCPACPYTQPALTPSLPLHLPFSTPGFRFTAGRTHDGNKSVRTSNSGIRESIDVPFVSIAAPSNQLGATLIYTGSDGFLGDKLPNLHVHASEIKFSSKPSYNKLVVKQLSRMPVKRIHIDLYRDWDALIFAMIQHLFPPFRITLISSIGTDSKVDS